MPTKKTSKLNTKKRSFYRNPAFVGVIAVFVAVGVFLTFNTFAASGPIAASARKDPGCPTDFTQRPTLAQGSSGACVWTLQTDLNTAQGSVYYRNGQRCGEAYSLNVDWQFGPATRAAVVNFQQNAGLAADGIVGPNTWAALYTCVSNKIYYALK